MGATTEMKREPKRATRGEAEWATVGKPSKKKKKIHRGSLQTTWEPGIHSVGGGRDWMGSASSRPPEVG